MREQGAGDMGIGHKLKAMANAFYGRLAAYDAAKDASERWRRRWPGTSGAAARSMKPCPCAGGLCRRAPAKP